MGVVSPSGTMQTNQQHRKRASVTGVMTIPSAALDDISPNSPLAATQKYILDRRELGKSVSDISDELFKRADPSNVGCVSLSELYTALRTCKEFACPDQELRELLRMVETVTRGFVCSDEFDRGFHRFARALLPRAPSQRSSIDCSSPGRAPPARSKSHYFAPRDPPAHHKSLNRRSSMDLSQLGRRGSGVVTLPEINPRRASQSSQQLLSRRESVRRSMDKNSSGGAHWEMLRNKLAAKKQNDDLAKPPKTFFSVVQHLQYKPPPTFSSVFESHARDPVPGTKTVYLSGRYLRCYVEVFRGVTLEQDGTVEVDELLFHLAGRAPALRQHLVSIITALNHNTASEPPTVSIRTLLKLLFQGASEQEIQAFIDAFTGDFDEDEDAEEGPTLTSLEKSKGLFDALDTTGTGAISRVEMLNGRRKGLVSMSEEDWQRIYAACTSVCFEEFFGWWQRSGN